jgi:Mn-dependent DtxR family transcriptional regulator
MLKEIIKAFKESNTPMDLNELSRDLGVERSALEGMLELLVRQGKLREIQPGSEVCTVCKNRSECSRLADTNMQGKVYELPE